MLKSAELAEALNVSSETVRQYAEAGRIPFDVTPGGHRRYSLEDVRYALAMERARKFEPLPEGEQEMRLAENPENMAPIRRAPSWRGTRLSAIIADAEAAEPRGALRIPFVGKPGTSRFIVRTAVS